MSINNYNNTNTTGGIDHQQNQTVTNQQLDPVTGAIIAAGTWAVEKAIQGGQNKKSREFQERMTKEQWKEEQRRWEQNNAYNDPSMVMARYKMAGLNPALMYKGTSTPATMMGKPEKQEGKFDLGGSQAQVAQMMLMAQMQKAQIRNLNSNSESVDLDNYDKKQQLGLTEPDKNKDGKVKNVKYVKAFNDAVKSAEDALTAEQQKILSTKKVDAQELENRILKVRADLAETGINFQNDNPIIRAFVTALAQQGVTLKDITAQLIKKYLP